MASGTSATLRAAGPGSACVPQAEWRAVRESLTKRPVTDEEMTTLVRRAFGPEASARKVRELDGGTYNAVFAVDLDDGRRLVLKVAPPPHLTLLTHELDLLRTEVDVYRRAIGVGVPVPEVVAADFDRTVIETDYAFLSTIDGVSLYSLRDTLPAAEVLSVRRQAAAAVVGLHGVTGTAYGYPLRRGRTWQPTWRAAFGAMVDDILADATRLDSDLPARPERIGDLMRRHADVLDDVDRPALVHYDLWDGNVFIGQDAAGAWRLRGFIDGERAFYGDPIAELCSLALFRAVEPEILDGYAEAGGTAWTLDASGQRRLDLYTTYLYLIMAIEGATRGWPGPDRALLARLDNQLARL
jgi:aminoglycoside phosphotransferase (APT) family kinase protein